MNLYNVILHRTCSFPGANFLFRSALRMRSAWFRLHSCLGGLGYRHPGKNRKIPADSVSGILLVRTDRIGDIVLSTPALHLLRSRYPSARITCVVQKKYRSILDCYDGWTDVVTIDNVHDNAELTRIGAVLRERAYDAAIVQHPSSYGYRLARYARPRFLIGWDAKGFGSICSHAIPDDRSVALRHQVDNNIRLLEPLHVRAEAARRVFPVKETTRGLAEADRFFLENRIDAKSPVLVVHPGSFSPRVRWFADRFGEVADRAIDHGMTCVVIGDLADKPLIDTMVSGMKNRPIVAVNRFSLEGLVSLFKRMTVFLGNSTGPMHIAASTGIRTVAIFGNRYPLDRAELWRPYGPNGVVVSAAGCVRADCIPWTCREMKCMKDVTVEMVWEAVVGRRA